ncbi:hypothetical protein DFH08DRAFT_1050118 [Mycena albidolilacea]|uniref:F-box domain-containing protein n=1 Tax=Mycena albidolilacea TaxID=1033008 RepID=A0AAD6Z6Q0_9AGAR|nr:hypothetical protein DFH08DRAFT_1050118 [Mycena albidolilacea]
MVQLCWKCGAPSAAATATASPILPPLLDSHRLLRSNDAPLDSEIPSIRDFISDGQNQVEILNSQINNLGGMIARLTRKRDEMAEHVLQHRVALSPVRRVPAELVCEILAMSLSNNDGGDDDNDGFKFPNAPPWHLGHICRFWRRTALAYPAFWSSITIPCYSHHVHFPPDAIKIQLRRSSKATLTVCWSAQYDDDTPDPRAVDLVVSHSSRWRALLLDIDYYYVELDWLCATAGRLVALETFVLRAHQLDGNPDMGFPDIFSPAPRLRNVLLTDWKLGSSAPLPKIPWAQITSYRGTFKADSQVEILEAARNLLSCSLGFRSESSTPEQDSSGHDGDRKRPQATGNPSKRKSDAAPIDREGGGRSTTEANRARRGRRRQTRETGGGRERRKGRGGEEVKKCHIMGEKIVKRTNRAYSSRLRRRTEAALEALELCKHNTVEDLHFVVGWTEWNARWTLKVLQAAQLRISGELSVDVSGLCLDALFDGHKTVLPCQCDHRKLGALKKRRFSRLCMPPYGPGRQFLSASQSAIRGMHGTQR